MTVIGGADGPTSVFVSGKLGMGWLNIWGLILIILILIPNIVYAIKNRGEKNRCTNKLMNILEQIGRYACMFFMIFNIGILEYGFLSAGAVATCIYGNIFLIIFYFIYWILFFKEKTYRRQMALAIIPTFIFLLNGITRLHILLIVVGIIFGIGHIYVTYCNAD